MSSSVLSDREKLLAQLLGWCEMMEITVKRIVKTRADDLPTDPWAKNGGWGDKETIVVVLANEQELYLMTDRRVHNLMRCSGSAGVNTHYSKNIGPYFTIWQF